MLPDITQTILKAKASKHRTFRDLAAKVECNPVFLAAACYRQASLTDEHARKLVKALDLSQAYVEKLITFPVKGGVIPAIPVNPLIYRFYEIMQIYDLPLKDVIQEIFGDGIMSAIDLTMHLEKEIDPKGDRAKIILSGKFLPYNKW